MRMSIANKRANTGMSIWPFMTSPIDVMCFESTRDKRREDECGPVDTIQERAMEIELVLLVSNHILSTFQSILISKYLLIAKRISDTI